jgi:hypothetical protein
MTVLTETRHRGEFLISEANGHRSRETVTMVSGTAALVAGAVLGKVTASGKYQDYDQAESNGAETAVAVLLDDCDASAADAECVAVVRDAEVNKGALGWITGADEAGAYVDLAGVGIICRDSTDDSSA